LVGRGECEACRALRWEAIRAGVVESQIRRRLPADGIIEENRESEFVKKQSLDNADRSTTASRKPSEWEKSRAIDDHFDHLTACQASNAKSKFSSAGGACRYYFVTN
jgi:hypothetical protein